MDCAERAYDEERHERNDRDEITQVVDAGVKHHDDVHVGCEHDEQGRVFPRDSELRQGDDEQDAKREPDQGDHLAHAGKVGHRNLVLALVDVEQGIVPELP